MMDLHNRLRSFGQMALVVFVLGVAAFLSGIMAMRLAIRSGEVQVPSLVGMRAGDAQAALAARRLGLRVADRVYSDQPPDRVVRQSPGPGMRVKVSQRVHVVLSLGPRKVPIPQLQGKSLRAARIELLRAGLQVGEVSTCHLPAGFLAGLPAALASQSPRGLSSSAPLGMEGPQPAPETIVQQSPLPGSPAAGPEPSRRVAGERSAESARVNVLVALPPEEASYVMPDFRALSLVEAQRRIATAGLRLDKISAVPAAAAPRGVVLQQAPPPGARIRAGGAVELEISE